MFIVSKSVLGKICLPCDDERIQLDSWKQRNSVGECCVMTEDLLTMIDKVWDMLQIASEQGS